ncbi:MAG: Type 1 glutamine amidotransferase-like domain-containing protein [Acidimicrobiia bacterium]
MSGTLALVGGGEFTERTAAIDEQLLAAHRDGSPVSVVVIPAASAFEHPSRVVDAAIAHFAALGASARGLNVLRRSDALDPVNAAALADAPVIYFSGGSPMHLRSVLKETPLWDAIVASWKAGATLVASGAAAAVFTDPMVDPRGGAYTLGLGLVAPLAVVPQHDTWSAERSRRTLDLAPAGVPVALIDTGAALVRAAGGSWTSIGGGSVSVHVDGHVGDLSALP